MRKLSISGWMKNQPSTSTSISQPTPKRLRRFVQKLKNLRMIGILTSSKKPLVRGAAEVRQEGVRQEEVLLEEVRQEGVLLEEVRQEGVLLVALVHDDEHGTATPR